jgi:glyoxylase-like metal-dependent hydrolase (beta-lactamase superfamily II)
VLVHEDDEGTLRRPRLKTGDASPRNLLPYLRRGVPWRLGVHLGRLGGARPTAVEGAETYSDGDVLDVPGSPRAVHTPGHTPGQCVLLFEGAGALFVGDALCSWNPLTGTRGPQLMPFPLSVDNERCVRSLDRIEALEAEVLLPGHGDPVREGPAAAVAHARRVGRS